MRSHCSPAEATGPGPPARSWVSGPARSWKPGDHRQPQAQREPGGLHALGDRPGPVSGPGPAGSTGGGAVGEEVQQPGGPRQQPAADGEAAERDGAQVADDRRVDQQVQRLGRQDDERRHGQGEHRRGAAVVAIMARNRSRSRIRGQDSMIAMDNSARRASTVFSRSRWEL